MICCLYNAENNALLGIGAAELVPQAGQAVIWRNREMPNFALETWVPATLNFETKVNTSISKRELLKRITADEYAAIKAAAALNGQIDYFWQMFLLSEEVVLNHPDTVAGFNTLEAVGILGAGRAAEILA